MQYYVRIYIIVIVSKCDIAIRIWPVRCVEIWLSFGMTKRLVLSGTKAIFIRQETAQSQQGEVEITEVDVQLERRLPNVEKR